MEGVLRPNRRGEWEATSEGLESRRVRESPLKEERNAVSKPTRASRGPHIQRSISPPDRSQSAFVWSVQYRPRRRESFLRLFEAHHIAGTHPGRGGCVGRHRWGEESSIERLRRSNLSLLLPRSETFKRKRKSIHFKYCFILCIRQANKRSRFRRERSTSRSANRVATR
jgi:hypothetical protein